MKPRVFVSYHHSDVHPTSRLIFSLGMYADVFWDKRSGAGNLWDDLLEKIDECQFFIVIMSKAYSESDSCKIELDHARKHQREIIPVRFYQYVDDNLTQLHYAPFVEDFEQGFRWLTQAIIQEPRSSWEYLGQESDKIIIESLGKGLLPGLIVKEVIEWAIVDYLWARVENFLHESDNIKNMPIFNGTPRTSEGVIRQCQSIIQQFANYRYFLGIKLVEGVEEIATQYINQVRGTKDDEYEKSGMLAATLMPTITKQLQEECLLRRKFSDLAELQANFDFNFAEKVREFVMLHSRRSRYLY